MLYQLSYARVRKFWNNIELFLIGKGDFKNILKTGKRTGRQGVRQAHPEGGIFSSLELEVRR